MKLVEMAYFSEDVAAMANFYRKFLGKEPIYDGGNIAIFMEGEIKIFLHESYVPDDENELPPENHSAFEVEDVDETCQRLQGQGLTIEVEPKDYYWGRSAYLRNPDGYMIELIQKGSGN